MKNWPTIKYVHPLDHHRLFVIFDNGVIKIYDFKERLKHPAFQELKDETLFQSVHIGSGGYGVIWNDDIDLSEYELWQNGKEVASVQSLSEMAEG